MAETTGGELFLDRTRKRDRCRFLHRTLTLR
jgi:hypothetical protein